MPSKAVEHVLLHLWALDIGFKGDDRHGYDARCPAHDDRNPSFHVGEGDDGRALVICYAGCTLQEIADALQIEVRELFEPEREEKSLKREVVERYSYTDEHGRLLYEVERLHPKGFRQRRPSGGGWEYSLGDTRRVLYRLPAVIEAVKQGRWVSIVEGERDVHTVEAQGHVATTCPGGAGKWQDSYSAVFRGAKVVIIMDVDAPDPKTGKRPGEEHALAVKRSLEGLAARVLLKRPAVGKDVSDHVAAGLTLRELVSVDEIAKERLRVLTAPEVMALPDPEQAGYLLGPLIYKGYRIVIGGHTGHGKTTLTMHMTACAVKGEDFLDPHFHGKGGLRALIVDVEQGTKSIKRVLREVGLDRNPNVQYLRVPDGLALDSDREAIAFMEKTFVQGRFDLVIADPLYKLHRGDPNDTQAATDLMRRFDDWRERYGFALLLPMHCRKPSVRAALSAHDLFGSSAYQWGAELLLGLERPQSADDGSFSLLHLWKDRDGEVSDVMPLNGKWGLMFDRLKGFRKANRPKTLDSRDVILDLLREHGGLRITEIERLWPEGHKAPSRKTLYNALDRLVTAGVTHDGHIGKEAKVWQLPVSMFDKTEV